MNAHKPHLTTTTTPATDYNDRKVTYGWVCGNPDCRESVSDVSVDDAWTTADQHREDGVR